MFEGAIPVFEGAIPVFEGAIPVFEGAIKFLKAFYHKAFNGTKKIAYLTKFI